MKTVRRKRVLGDFCYRGDLYSRREKGDPCVDELTKLTHERIQHKIAKELACPANSLLFYFALYGSVRNKKPQMI